jgi:hypothetical protein
MVAEGLEIAAVSPKAVAVGVVLARAIRRITIALRRQFAKLETWGAFWFLASGRSRCVPPRAAGVGHFSYRRPGEPRNSTVVGAGLIGAGRWALEAFRVGAGKPMQEIPPDLRSRPGSRRRRRVHAAIAAGLPMTRPQVTLGQLVAQPDLATGSRARLCSWGLQNAFDSKQTPYDCRPRLRVEIHANVFGPLPAVLVTAPRAPALLLRVVVAAVG